MKAHNWTQYWFYLSRDEKNALAEKVGVGRVHLSKIAGGHSTPSDELVKRLCDADKDISQLWFTGMNR